MKKSVYSLVLSDDVVKAIDDMAYRLNTSRSNLINQILAEQVSYKTPESIMKDVFDCLKTIMDTHFQIQGQASDAMLSIRSPLRYKYKPTIRYRVELLKQPENDTFGRLSVSFRTQSAQLLSLLESFFGIWYEIEKKYIAGFFRNGVEYACSDGRFIRNLKFTGSKNAEILGKAIGDYISLLDTEIKIYFAGIENTGMAAAKMEKMLVDSLNSGMTVI